jgi:hypothetical protein
MPDAGSFSLAYTILKDASKSLNVLRERAQSTNDIEIKAQVGAMYDHVNNLREVISRFANENEELKKQLEQQQHPPEKRQVGEAFYYYKGGEDGPYCQACYDTKHTFIALQPQEHTPWGAIKRVCLVCKSTFHEKRVPEPPKVNFGGQWR